jgi:hypothetical protein
VVKVSKRYLYGGKPFLVNDASGVKGILIRSESKYFFRVYKPDGESIDYEIKHDDLEVTISNEVPSWAQRRDHPLRWPSKPCLSLSRHTAPQLMGLLS